MIDYRKTRRPDSECRIPAGLSCLQFLKEKKYMELEPEIRAEIRRREADKLRMVEVRRLPDSKHR